MRKLTPLCLLFLFIYVSTFSQETGTNDFRISDMGTDGVTSIDGDRAAVAYNSTTGQYLVVWEGDDVDGEQEIYGQLINATTGAEVGSDFRISNMTSTGVTIYRGSAPSVAYNATTNEFLVVWTGDTNSGGLIDGETEVWGQRISAAGAEVGSDFRISDTNGTGNALGLSSNAKVTWNATDNEYLVVWSATDPSLGMIYLEFEIFGQRLSSTGAEVGTNDFRISDMGGTGVVDPDASNPDVVWNSTNNEYMVVWYGSESTANGLEIYAQRLTNAGAEVGTNDFVISDMGDASTTYSAFNPEIAYNATNNEYLVVWQSDDNSAPLVDNEVEIFGQRLSNVGAELGTNDFRISTMGDDSETIAATRDNFRGGQPDVAWNSSNNMYMVVWEGEDDTQALDDGEVEIFGRLISNTNTLLGSQLRISNLGGEGNSNFDAGYPAIAVTGSGGALIAFEGENDTGSLADGEEEIWGQLFTVAVANSAPSEIFINPPTIASGTTSGTKISDLFAVDADQANSFTYTLVAGTGSTDNTAFAVSGTDLNANTTFDFATKSTYNLRLQVSDGTTTYQQALTMTVNAPVTTLVGSDFKISTMGPASNTDYDANAPDVAYNSTDDEFLVVWHGDNTTDNKTEIYGQRVRASDGALQGSQFLISSNVPGDANYDATSANVAYNSTNNQYLVVWHSDDNSGGMVDNETEIFGRIVNANGTLSGSQIRVSDAGGSGSTLQAANDPDVAYNATNNQYLVVWEADDSDFGLGDGVREIFGQRISNTGAEVGSDFRISNSTLTASSDANDPAVAWNSTNNEYLVVWDADPVDSHTDVMGQRVSNVGAEIGADFLIIDAGATTSFDADVAAVVYNATDNQFLVAADVDTALDGKNEIYTIRVSNVGAVVGSVNKASDHVTGNASYDAFDVALAYLPDAGEYVAVWEGESNDGGLIDNEFETYLQRITNTNTDTGIDDERVSTVGGTGNNLARVLAVNAAYSTTSKRVLIVWQADDTDFSVVDNENEIFGQLWMIPNAADTTAPVFENSTPSSSAVAQTGFTLGTDIDEAGNIYYVVVPDGATAPTASEVKAGTASGGGSAVTSGNAAVSTGGFTNNFSVTGLTAGTAYDVYVVAEDDEGTPNLQASPTKIDVTTTSLIALTITGLTGNNKVYDDNTSGSATGTATLSGVVGGDDVSLGGSPTFTFASSNVGTGITINTTGYTISGTDSGKYTLTQPTLSGDITAKTLTITGLTGDNKVYDDNTAGSATGTATLVGVESGDDVSLGGSPVFTFASSNVGTGITINTTGYTISGTDSGNYTLTQPTLSGNITAKTLTIVGLTGNNKVYDGNTAGSATGTATLAGVEAGDDVSLGGSPVFTFASANVGTGITINSTGYTISGTDSGNYSLSQPTLSGDITAATLTVVGLTGNNKVYDGTTAGTASGTATLSGVIGADDVSLGGSPVFTFASANVGIGITLNTSGYTISGTDSGNYTLTQPTLSADITAGTLTIVGLTGDDKIYDGTTAGTATGTATLSGVIGADDVILGGSPVFTFASASVGTGITMNTTGYTISGTDSGNYTLTQPTLSADINGIALTIVGLTGNNKVYDGTTAGTATGTATLSGVVGGDDVSLAGSPVYTFASANVGTGITITTTGFTLTGADAGKYSLTQPTLSADITAATLTVVGLTGDNKVYDGTTAGTATGTATLSGVIGADDVILGGSPVFTFASANVGTGITLNTSGYTISGTDSGNYTLTQPTLSADITAATLTIVGLTGDNKVYDSTTAGTASGTATLSGVIGADDVILGGSPLYTFASANVGTGITINSSGFTISGTDSGNYTLTQPTLSADITAATLTVVGLTGNNKVYDGTTAGTATGTPTLSGVIGADKVSLGGSAVFTFASANVGTGITINTSGYTISGADSGNYTLTQPTLSADITAAVLTVTGLTGNDKIFDGTTAATVSGTPVLSGIIGADDVILGGSPVYTFASPNVGTGITINTSGFTISGTDSGNYSLTQPTMSADITYPTVSFTSTSSNGLESVNSANLSVDLSTSFASTVTVDYTVTGTALGAGTDYSLANGTLTFNPGSTSENIVIANIVSDMIVELDETVIVTLSNPTNGALGTNTVHTYTITNDDSASLSIDDVTRMENADGGATTDFTFTVTLSGDVDTGFTVATATSDNTANAGSDFVTGLGVLAFAGNNAETQTFTVTVNNENVLEADETFNVLLSNVQASGRNVTINDGTGVGTINNDDSASVTIADISGNEDDGNITVTATLDNPVQGGFTVDVNTADGTAMVSDNDYTSITGQTLTFTGNAGETQTFTITPTSDTKVEANETLTVSQNNLGGTSLAVVITDGATVTIGNDDTSSVILGSVSTSEDNGAVMLTATLINAVQGGFTVDVNTVDGTATLADNDYTAVVGETLTFAGVAGETQTFTVTPTADTKLEPNETVTISQSNLAGTSLTVIITGTAVVKINNDDNAAVTIADVSGNEDDGSITLTATLDNAVQGGFSVDVNTADGTATIADSDYTSVTSQTLTFTGTAGETHTFTVTPTSDTKVEADETVMINQNNLGATTLGVDITDGATVTFTNDDSTVISLADITVDEDQGTINVVATLSNAVQGGFTLNASTMDGTAMAPGDFTALSNQPIPFSGTAGETQNISVSITDDTVGEETEMFTMLQSSVSGTTLGGSIDITDIATITIIDDDAPVVTMVSVPADGNYGIGDHLDFTVSFTNAATVSGSPSIPITIGSVTRQAVVNGTFTGSLTVDFRYTIVEGDLDTDGIAVGTDILLNGGSIVGSTNIDAILTLNNVASTANVNVDGIKPTVAITTNAPDPTNSSFTATFTFSEDVTGFELGDVTVGNGAASGFVATSATVYTATITPATDGIVTVDVNADVAFDAVSNPNIAASQYSVLYDATRPTLLITSPAPDPTNMPFTVTFTFSEPVLNFEMADLVITNGTPSAFTVIDSQTYTALITPGVTANVIVQVPDNVAEDPATNGNEAASFTIEFDNTPPDIPYVSHISEYTCTGNVLKTGDNTLEISGSAEPLSTVEVFINGSSIGTTPANNSGFFTYDHTGTTLADGIYDITVTATDAATNTSPVSNTLTIEIDSVDSDGDGLPDFCDDDADGNGVTDTTEDCDGDGIIDSLDTDNSSCTSNIQSMKTYGFSPNGDGINDGWFIEGITAYPNSVVQVFNRSGKLVFKKKGYQNDWTAVSNQISNSGNNSRLPVGPYIFVIDLGDGSKPIRGWLYINY